MSSKCIILVVVFFLALLTALPQYAQASTDDTGFLWLVNRENVLPNGYVPKNLTQYGNLLVQKEAHEAFTQMKTAMAEDGITGLRLQSAYRPYSHQQAIFNRRINELVAKGHAREEAELLAAKSIQPPGASEHQLGLALDVSIDGKLTQAFGDTAHGKWLEDNCYKHGFIIRYPREKTDITQIVYEPWHLRYVGAPHAYIMKNLGLTLEEYLDYIRDAQMYVTWGEDTYYLLMYSEVLPEDTLSDVVHISSIFAEKQQFIITMQRRRH